MTTTYDYISMQLHWSLHTWMSEKAINLLYCTSKNNTKCETRMGYSSRQVLTTGKRDLQKPSSLDIGVIPLAWTEDSTTHQSGTPSFTICHALTPSPLFSCYVYQFSVMTSFVCTWFIAYFTLTPQFQLTKTSEVKMAYTLFVTVFVAWLLEQPVLVSCLWCNNGLLQHQH